ncbi:F-box only protein 46 [Engraulis encrasicolus]|uniref:F-box only protein 46 n=1 Tax=Engraulis encrasicolus TaxID=184585 RepID=UPI002FD5F0F5
MNRDTFSHIRLWCPRPFGTYSQNQKPYGGAGTGPGGGGGSGGGTSSPPPPLCKADAALGRTSLEGEQEEEEEDAGTENMPPSEDGTQTMQPPQPPPPPPAPPSPTAVQVEDGRVLLDTWYVIKPGNTKEKIAFFVAHQFSGAGLPRPSAMKVKGNWATDCTKAKRRRRCSSYDPPVRTPGEAAPPDATTTTSTAHAVPVVVDENGLAGVSETDLLSVAEMVALVEQRTAMALQGMVMQGQTITTSSSTTSNHHHHHSQANGGLFLPDSDSAPVVYMSEEDAASLPDSISTDLDEQGQEGEEEDEDEEGDEDGGELQLGDTRRVAQAVAHYESQQSVENATPPAKDRASGGEKVGGLGSAPGPPPPHASHGRGEVRIAFRVSSIDSRSQSEPAGRPPRCMFMSCGSAGTQTGARAKEKITCDLYQLLSPSSRDPSLLLAQGASSKAASADGGDAQHSDRPPCSSSSACTSSSSVISPCSAVAEGAGPELGVPVATETTTTKKNVSRERVTGFHVEVVVTGAVDQCVFYGKDSTENVQEETVCFAKSGGGGGGVGSSTDAGDDPPPGQLFFLQPATPADEHDVTGTSTKGGVGLISLDCANNNNNSGGPLVGGKGVSGVVANGAGERPISPILEDGTATSSPDSSSSLCRLYRHVSHDFLEIRFQIQRLLEPRQYMLSLPDHIMVNIFSYLPTRSLAALKCTCHDFKALIETYGVRATDSRWNQDPQYRDDPCKQCKRQYARGDVSLCRWHPKPYHHDLPYGRSYWMCCRRTDKDTPGCRVGLHDNNWVQQPCDHLGQTRAKRDDGR